jgi:predicted ABC-type ATPase
LKPLQLRGFYFYPKQFCPIGWNKPAESCFSLTSIMPQLYIIAGCNGAGKTTASLTVLPEMLDCHEFVNADMIAYGLSPLNPEGVAFAAGRIMLARIRELISEQKDFAFETTLSTRSYVSLIKDARESGYTVTLLFFWLHSPEEAMMRVAERVRNGGHHIPDDVVKRRYGRGIANFFGRYFSLADYWMFVDNSGTDMTVIAEGEREVVENIENIELWNSLQLTGNVD